jgi:hypothetical protein
MTMKIPITAVSAFLAAAVLYLPPSFAQDAAALRQQADAIRASADDIFKLRKIPWVTDPAEGFRLAKEENRPVFLYVQAGDPLEDC